MEEIHDEKKKEGKDGVMSADGRLFPVIGLGDVSELLLDGVAVDVVKTEGLGGRSGQTAPLGRVPTAGGGPHRVHAGSLREKGGEGEESRGWGGEKRGFVETQG